MPVAPLRFCTILLALSLAGIAGCGGSPATPGGWTPPSAERPTLSPTYRPTGHAEAGDVFVHLFSWKWTDVARECESVLGPLGYRGVQVAPPQEHVVLEDGPWWERYQPVSYSLGRSRSGTGAEFADMVQRCEVVGVDVYVDAVLNHMTAGEGTGSDGTAYTKYNYPGLYSPEDFHSPCTVDDYQNAANVQDCELLGLADLHTGRAGVRERIADYLIGLGRLGVAGFRVDAAKHIQPVELDSILGLVNTAARTEGRPVPYVFAEVADYGSEAVGAEDFFGLGFASGGGADITEFRFRGIAEKFAGTNGQALAELSGFPGSWGLIPWDKAVVFVENHDTQREAGAVSYRSGDVYRLANVWMLAQPYGYPKVMSGYAFAPTSPGGRDQGPPSNAFGETGEVSCAEEMEAAFPGEWVCEHRDPAIAAMVAFRREVAGTGLEGWWDNGANAIAFSRGDRGFAAINREEVTVWLSVSTPLPPGTYCDVLSGGALATGCAGKTVVVGTDGIVQTDLGPDAAVAIHVGARR